MWALENKTPYAAERTWIRDKRGVHHWVVAVKASFDVSQQGEVRLSDEQRPPLRIPEYEGEPGASSLLYEMDLGAMKPATDITLVGSAYAPHGSPVRQVVVGMQVGEVSKRLVVHGPRVYARGLTGVEPSPAAHFVTRPLSYSLAFGGFDTAGADPSAHALDSRNPIGCGFARDASTLVDRPAPSVEYLDGDRAQRGPAGFGPLASYWSPRLEYQGTYDAAWSQRKKPLLPDDYDERATLCAPVDQRPAQYLRGGEPVALENVTPQGLLRFQLPKIYPTFATHFGRRREDHRARLVSVVLEPDAKRFYLVWQTALPVRGDQTDYLDRTVVDEKEYL